MTVKRHLFFEIVSKYTGGYFDSKMLLRYRYYRVSLIAPQGFEGVTYSSRRHSTHLLFGCCPCFSKHSVVQCWREEIKKNECDICITKCDAEETFFCCSSYLSLIQFAEVARKYLSRRVLFQDIRRMGGWKGLVSRMANRSEREVVMRGVEWERNWCKKVVTKNEKRTAFLENLPYICHTLSSNCMLYSSICQKSTHRMGLKWFTRIWYSICTWDLQLIYTQFTKGRMKQGKKHHHRGENHKFPDLISHLGFTSHTPPVITPHHLHTPRDEPPSCYLPWISSRSALLIVKEYSTLVAKKVCLSGSLCWLSWAKMGCSFGGPI